MADLPPDFDSLPPVEGQPQGNAWGLWGEDDQLGTLNLLTPSVKLAARDEIKSGISISLDQPLDWMSHTIAGRQHFEHKIIDFQDNEGYFKIFGYDDSLHINTQSSSQWDGLRHVAIQDSGLRYNGATHAELKEKGNEKLGTHHWVRNGGIVGRGILLDYVRWRSETNQPPAPAHTSHPITVTELEAVAAHQHTTFQPGDILIVRSGFTLWHNAATQQEREEVIDRGAFIGLERSMESVKWLWNHHFAAVAGDTLGFECCPVPFGVEGEVVIHEWLLAHWGSPLGELWDLETLSEVCKREGRWSFFFTSAPLHVVGGVASPPNAIAVL